MRPCTDCGLDRDDPKTHDMHTGECAAKGDWGLPFMWLAETAHELYQDKRVPGVARCVVMTPEGQQLPLQYFALSHTPAGPVVTFYVQKRDPGLPWSLLGNVEIHGEPTEEDIEHVTDLQFHLFGLFRSKEE